VVGERWTLVIVQELLKRPSRYGELSRRLPGIGTTVLADRLRKLEAAGVVERVPGAVGKGVAYALTDRGAELNETLEALRRWGVSYLTDPAADGTGSREFDIHYVDGIEKLDDAEFEFIVDTRPVTLRFSSGHLTQTVGAPGSPMLTVRTTSAFMDRWAAGSVDWQGGRDSGEVMLEGPESAWHSWLAATGYLLTYDPDGEDRRK